MADKKSRAEETRPDEQRQQVTSTPTGSDEAEASVDVIVVTEDVNEERYLPGSVRPATFQKASAGTVLTIEEAERMGVQGERVPLADAARRAAEVREEALQALRDERRKEETRASKRSE